jgi:hypothetical protein
MSDFNPLRPNHGYRHSFEWRMPKAVITYPAEHHRFAIHPNRYPGVLIGIQIQVGSRALSLLWGRPGPLTADSCKDCALGVEHIDPRLPR